eukprot:gnl/TRDRNA2_/TRDRNA2_163881_c0_seq4.p1 gnl/TRDRNA2_/TRDRNA2_163881_c0~~gnl/TRDRNA2_/TRDRNA2_163881_c0_seq4.p1  ORF type:complete len:248 (-),score=34.47 gnl/TRDRNA2_/TRDRNA2_163881_c0_seq4:60-803(-)
MQTRSTAAQTVLFTAKYASRSRLGWCAGPLRGSPHLLHHFQLKASRCLRRHMLARWLRDMALIQTPWRQEDAKMYFQQAINSFANAAKNNNVDTSRVFLETRPPIGVSAVKEKGLDTTERERLGFETGRVMFEAMRQVFGPTGFLGFCVAGGSTSNPQKSPNAAMEDDTQDAVRQGIRKGARAKWGYDVCFWEMGAKLMLQPEVGQKWGHSKEERDAAQRLFCENAEKLAKEISGSREQAGEPGFAK